MSGSKIRNIAIVSLVLINMLFLAVIILDAADDAGARRESVENLSAIFKANGITINPGAIREADALRAMRTLRDIQTEETIAQVFLGETVKIDQGVIHTYENPLRGIAFFYSAGDFSIQLFDGIISSSPDEALGMAEYLLSNMGIETTALTVFSDSGNETEIVTATAAYREVSVFNGIIEFVFVRDNLHEVRGRYVAGFEPMEDGAAISYAATALLGFLSAVIDEDRYYVTCTEITYVEAGFRHRIVGLLGEGVVEPAWLLTTDNGRFMIDDITGEIWVLG